MPYIDSQRRKQLTEQCYDELFYNDLSAGDLNFIISKLLTEHLKRNFNYDKINELIGVLECAKLELYRRQAAPYEDMKMLANGDL